jgi:hypothetical protein
MPNGIRKNKEYSEWVRVVTTKMAHLSKPQAVVLAMWSFGMVMIPLLSLSEKSTKLRRFSLGKIKVLPHSDRSVPRAIATRNE